MFRLLFDQLGPAHAEQLLGVKPRVYKRWLNGSTPVPRCAVLALYWESSYGRSPSQPHACANDNFYDCGSRPMHSLHRIVVPAANT